MPPPSIATTQPPSQHAPSPSRPPKISRFHAPAAALLIYPATLALGSIFSVLSPTAHAPPPGSAASQTTPAPNYFARKNNIFNTYFVKVGWIWMTLASAALILAYAPHLARGRRQAQAALRYALATAVWYATTQWFFGPPVIDRSFVLTGGKCEAVLRELSGSIEEKGVLGSLGEEKLGVYLTAAACKAAGGAWRGGHDVSGHVFMLVLVTAALGFEVLGLLAQGEGETARRDETVVNGGVDGDEKKETEVTLIAGSSEARKWTLRFVGVVIGLSWWMLLMTAIWFHTWLEKANGLLISLAAVYAIYILPRRVIPWRNIVGIPGV
ncbi:inositol phospholipid synthesis and fat-storage-inducing TM-domain-containing protein [Aspergillus pseudodeflectus]|uniref:Acyl-coenzyme A diphosphatase SCS3 n=1 Tax=Aspergillus pseudodeflectus TaxID=176178 RepID=A0ABR4KBB8_9EURO